MSRRHARLRGIAGGWAVSDMNSTNGVCLNDEKLAPESERALIDGDVLLFGGGPDRDPDLGVTYVYEVCHQRVTPLKTKKRRRSEDSIKKKEDHDFLLRSALERTTKRFEAQLEKTTRTYEARLQNAVSAVECRACRRPLARALVLDCGHGACTECFLDSLGNDTCKCPTCAREIKTIPATAPCLDAAVDALLQACDDNARHAHSARLARDLSRPSNWFLNLRPHLRTMAEAFFHKDNEDHNFEDDLLVALPEDVFSALDDAVRSDTSENQDNLDDDLPGTPHDKDLFCDNCGNISGHLDEHCPHRHQHSDNESNDGSLDL